MIETPLREGEVAVDIPEASDAGLVFIGRIRTPWKSREETPRQGSHNGPVCRIEIFEPWVPALLQKSAPAQPPELHPLNQGAVSHS